MTLFRREGRRRRLPVVVLTGALFAFQAIALIGAQSASAAFASCQFTGGVLLISLNAGDTVTISANASDEITIDANNTNTAGCTGAAGNATLANTTAINITGDTGDETVNIDLSVDWGTINWAIDLQAGTADVVNLDGSAGSELDVVAGASGVDLNNDEDLDATLAGVEELDVQGSPDADSISGAGGTAAGAATDLTMVVNADAGDDVVSGGSGDDTLDGGADNDTVDYSGFSAAVDVDLAAGTATGGGGTDTLTGFENVMGSSAGDTLAGDGGPNVITPGAGDDTVDCVGGGAGDTVDFSNAAAAVTVDLDAGTATGDGTDTIDNCDDVFGSDFDDIIAGDADVNGLYGGGGNDSISGGDGDDIIDGEAGIDWVDYSAAAGDVTVDLASATDPLGATAGSCNDASEFTSGESGEADCLAHIENAALGTGDDTFTGNAFNNTVQPGGGQNVLDGANGSDTLDYSVGYEEGVTVNLAGGSSSVDAITSFENVIGTEFGDNITGDDSSNTLRSRKGADNVRGGSGDDTIKAGADNDRVRGGSGDDDMWGQKGNDYLNGGNGDDFCKGGPGKDIVRKCEGGKK